ncbi:NrfD/PsrC family molybdoenzyme membrane anchor subunit [Actinomadura sp. 3N508]|uniref:NrfD/PsrC family molybdoenzyme membrane anchor subunit n=1 Tax=Actinomadura sp. 3N508 TaxID=3375153 RepID=UPI0037B48412
MTGVLAAPLPVSPWGGLLAAYFTVIGLPSGLTLATWWRRARNPAADLALDWRATWVCLLLLSGAGLLLTVDLGRPERFFLMLTRFGNWDSPISLGAKIIAVKTFLLGTALYLLWRRRAAATPGSAPPPARGMTRHLDQTVVWLLGFTSLALAVYPIAVLARSWVSPLAATSGAALLYLITALLMGIAAIQLLDIPQQPARGQASLYRQVTLVLLLAYTVALLFTAVSVTGEPAEAALDALATGQWAPLLYGGVLGIGLLLPAVTLTIAWGRRWAAPAAAVAILIGACTLRYLIFTA